MVNAHGERADEPATLEGADLFDTPHIAEALQHCKRDGDQAERPGKRLKVSDEP